MPTFTQQAYVNKMLPHLLPKEAKKRGIKQSDKIEWKNLAKELKAYLKNRYLTSLEADLNEDISFNNKGISKLANNNQYRINDKVVDRLSFISTSKREWIRQARWGLLDKATFAEKEIINRLTDSGVESWQKAPFVFNGETYFAGIFIPQKKLVIEVVKKNMSVSQLYGSMKQRKHDFEFHGIRFMLVSLQGSSFDAIIKQILRH